MMKNNTAVGPQVRAPRKKGSALLPSIGAASILGGIQTATQFFAYRFGYQSALGPSFLHIYAPWKIFQWSAWSQYSDEVMKAASMGMVVSTVGLLSVAVTQVVLSHSSKAHHYMHGSARWADQKDIEQAGLLPRKKSFVDVLVSEKTDVQPFVYVGGWTDKKGIFHYLRHSGPEHVLCYAPTRSGKGVGLVVPTLLSWAASAVITDLKGELWELTAGWRQKHASNKVLCFEPAASGGVRWNPLDEIRLETEFEVGDVQNLASLIVDPHGQGLESHWQKTAFSLLVGVVLHALYKARKEGHTATLPKIDAMFADVDRDISELWMEMATYPHKNGEPHAAVAAAARDMMDRPEEEAGSVLSTAKSYLSLYRDPLVAKNVSSSDFKIKDLMYNDSPISLYIVTQPTDKTRLKPLVRILVSMIVRHLTDKMKFRNGRPIATYKHRLLLMLDEFPSLGKLEVMQESLAFIAGYGIKAYLICQDVNQLKSKETGYGADESLTSNCHVQCAFPPNRIETAEHLSKLTGQTTVVKEQITTSGRRTAAMLGRVSRTLQEVQRPLLTPDECLRMPGPKKNALGEIETAGDMVIYMAGYPAIYGRQPLYFQDDIFQARASVPAPRSSDRLCIDNNANQNPEIVL